MNSDKSLARRLGRVLEGVTRQNSRIPITPEYGSWVLGRVSESQRRRRVRIQVILTTFVIMVNLLGIGISMIIVTLLFPSPDVFAAPVRWITFIVAPLYMASALIVGVFWATTRVIDNVPQNRRVEFVYPQ